MEEVPDSPFYIVQRGELRIEEVRSGLPIGRKTPGGFINWCTEYVGDESSVPSWRKLLRKLLAPCAGARDVFEAPRPGATLHLVAALDGAALMLMPKG